MDVGPRTSKLLQEVAVGSRSLFDFSRNLGF